MYKVHKMSGHHVKMTAPKALFLLVTSWKIVLISTHHTSVDPRNANWYINIYIYNYIVAKVNSSTIQRYDASQQEIIDFMKR